MTKAITDRYSSGSIARGATLCSALLVSVMVNAQAPVYDVNNDDTSRRANASQGPSVPTGTVEQRVAILERMVDSRTQMQHRLQQQLDTMQGEIDELRGAVEVHTNQLEKVLERQRELYLEIDKRVEALKQGNTAVSADDSTDYGVTQPVSRPSASQEDESTAYDNAVNLILQSREYDKAIPAFQAFIQRFPNSQYAPNAHYWLGQLLFNKQEWAQAQEQFEIVSSRFSNSSKRADALLKLGVIAERQNNNQRAKQFYQQVIEMYPNSSARKLAESRISGL
ncbi:tol-pal system protein YbgF [Alteromonas ponticola]|uniref:Cell division coordinator CpoB n=1 Tax=Alteromonas aquimaris TaxID=2998417 RepID=A0ABT3P4Z5_9ALTE|nr:tol-pal system protein YbgF [Alteromonas aquimaris]MCW8107843.1 tol-pal system protein YbgF [Alteromonas aquimaris]